MTLSAASLHPGLISEYRKLRNFGLVLAVFALLSISDLVATLQSSDAAILQWRPVIVPALVMVLLLAPCLIYFYVWRRMVALRRASAVVRSNSSRDMLLKTWKKGFFQNKTIYFFDLEPVEPFGCRSSSFFIVMPNDSQAALPKYCDQSWQTRAAVSNVVKAFVDEETGLPVAVQTIDALEWVSLNIHSVRSDDKEKMLKKQEEEGQLSGDLK